jgi:hypothetical protein
MNEENNAKSIRFFVVSIILLSAVGLIIYLFF